MTAPKPGSARENPCRTAGWNLAYVINYLGSCHAATIEIEGSLKRTPKHSLRRYIDIGREFLLHMTPDSREHRRLVSAIKYAERRLTDAR